MFPLKFCIVRVDLYCKRNMKMSNTKVSKLSYLSPLQSTLMILHKDKCKSCTPHSSIRSLWIVLVALAILSPAYHSKPLGEPRVTYTEKANLETATGERELHFVPHSHIDPMWYTEFRISMNHYAYPIYKSMSQALTDCERYKFTLIESCFTRGYLDLADAEFKEMFMRLVKSGRVDFQGGGYVMHDEACPYFDEMIMNLSYGRLYLQSLGVKLPTVAWMIDTFGHGTTNMRLHSQMGYKYLVFGRLSQDVKSQLHKNRDLQFQWVLPSNPNYHLTVHQLGYFYMVLKPFSTIESYTGIKEHEMPVSNITKSDFNLDSKILEFVFEIKQVEAGFGTKYMLSPFGGDNNFRNAPGTFRLIDMIVIFIKCNRVRMELNPKISNLDEYFGLVEKENITLSKISHDFFPNIDDIGRGLNHTSWSGFYTTNPGYKHRSDTYTRNIRSIVSLTSVNLLKNSQNEKFLELHKALEHSIHFSSLLINHDTITGTSKDSVLGMVCQRISKDLELLSNKLLDAMIAQELEANGVLLGLPKLVNLDSQNANGRSKDFGMQLHYLKTMSSLELGPNNVQRQVLVINSLSPKPQGLVRLITKMNSTVEFPGALWKHASCMKADHCESVFLLSGYMPLGMHRVLSENVDLVYSRPETINPNTDYRIFFGAGIVFYFKLNEDGNLKFVGTDGNELSVGFFRYGDTYDKPGDNDGASGKYVFTANDRGTRIPVLLSECRFSQSPDLQSLSVVLAFFDGSFRVELKYIHAAPPAERLTLRYLIDDIANRPTGSYTVRLSTSFTGQKFVTDSNGLEEEQRDAMTEKSIFVDAEYYPVTKFIYMQNDEKRFTVVTDRCEGGAFLSKNEIELMLHRTSQFDDKKGVQERESSMERVSILHYLIFEERLPIDRRLYRSLQTTLDYHTMILELPGNMFTISNTTSSIWGANTTSADGGNKSWPSEYLRVSFERSYYSDRTYCRLVYLHDTQSLDVNVPALLKEFYSIDVQRVEEWTLDMTSVMVGGEGSDGNVKLVPLDIRTFKIILAGST